MPACPVGLNGDPVEGLAEFPGVDVAPVDPHVTAGAPGCPVVGVCSLELEVCDPELEVCDPELGFVCAKADAGRRKAKTAPSASPRKVSDNVV